MSGYLRQGGFLVLLFGACLMPLEAYGQDTAALQSGKELLPYIVHHMQGWGSMGLDTCVFSPTAAPAPLKIGDREYATGLGVHAPGETWLALERRFSLFEAEVGVQKQAQDQGSVVFRVYADDKLVFDSGVMRGTDPAKPVRIPVEGVHYLKLEYGDAGDGHTCDCANWANLRLTPANAAAEQTSSQPLDIAPFGRVLTWNPYVKDGTHTERAEEFPAKDLFPGNAVARGKDGTYSIPVVQSPFIDMGMGCIGLEWLEQRRLRRVELHFAGAAPSPAGTAVEYWALTPTFDGTPGVSRWQGHWEHLNADIAVEGNRWAVNFPLPPNGWQRPRTMKLRWLIPRELGQSRIARLAAFTDSEWREADITLRALKPAAGQQATVNIYNGAFADLPEGTVSLPWPLGEPLRLRVRYAAETPWTRSERTVLRLSLPDQAFGIAVPDVLASDGVYVEHAGIVASRADREQAADAAVAASADKRTILEEIRQLPEQTFAQALERVHRPDADLGPTLLSLANGNQKFLLQRTGAIGFDAPGIEKLLGQDRTITPSWEGQSDKAIQRHLDGEWMPIPVITHQQGGVTVQQRTFVAPFGLTDKTGKASWYHDKPLCIAEYTFTNPGDAANVSLTLACAAKEAVSLRTDARGAVVESGGEFLALLDTTKAQGIAATVNAGNIALAGSLPAGAEARCVLLIPGWKAAPEAMPAAGDVAGLLEATREHWRAAMAGSTQITTPDAFLNNVITASRVHCMLAARNEDGVRVAPWVASTNYGPLESEGHSVIRGMEFMGHSDFAQRGLDFFINRYNDDGYLTTGYTVIGTGWHLWALGEYAKLYRNDEWLRGAAQEIDRVCNWILEQRTKTQQTLADGRPLEYGLMPPGVLADWGVYSHYFYLDGNYYAGLKWAGDALADIGWEKADAIRTNAQEFRSAIENAFRHVQGQTPVLPLRDGTWVPAYPTQLYCPMPIADMYAGDDVGRSWAYDVELGSHHLVPMGVLDARDPSVDWMMNHMEDVQFLESGWFYYPKEGNQADWFNLGGFAKVQPYYARNAEVCAMRDDVKPFIRNYFNSVVSLLNREDLSLWEHFMNGAFNKTHETGYFLHQSRLMFVMERDKALWLAPFVPTQWLEDGKVIDVQDAPTFFGNVGFTIASHLKDGLICAGIKVPQRQMPEEIVVRLRHPQGKTLVSAEVEGATEFRVVPEDSTVRLKPIGALVTLKAHYTDAAEPAVPYHTVVAPAGPDNPRNSEADIIPLKDGSLLLGWSDFYTSQGEDHGPARISAKLSTDGGKTWSEERTLVENEGGCNVMEVNFIRLKDDRIALFYCRKNTESTDCRVMMRTSADEGKTWGEPLQISPDNKYTGLTNGRSIRLASGRILLEAWENGDSYCYLSDDDGKTWRESQRVKPAKGCWEPACVELKDGRVMMLMRTEMGGQYKSISSDGGQTWTEPVETPLKGSGAPVSISRVPETGDLLAIWNHNPGTNARTPLTAALSKDEGETWEHLRNIEEEPGDTWAYPAVTWVDNRAILTYFNYKGGLSLQLKILPREWFYE